jgi:hypothetical protein
MTRATRFSYLFFVAVIVLAAATHLATPLITVLFSYFALRKLYFGKRKWLSLLLFFVVVSATLYGLGFLIRQAFVAFPKIAAESIPPFIAYAQSHGIALDGCICAHRLTQVPEPLWSGLTFLCGLLPIVGNLISNAIIVGIAVTMSPRLAIVALIFLVAVHKAGIFPEQQNHRRPD